MAQIGFYATAEDLLPICEAIEQKESIRYVEMGRRSSASFPEYLSAKFIPSFGSTKGDQLSWMESYLMLDIGLPVNVEPLPNRTPPGYWVYEGINPFGIELTPAGVFEPGILLAGRLATLGLTDRSSQLYRRVASRIRKAFRKVGAYYVGPTAFGNLASGWRLTAAIQSPASYDLSLPDQA